MTRDGHGFPEPPGAGGRAWDRRGSADRRRRSALRLRRDGGADVQGEALDLIGSAELDFPEFTNPE
jgi:hypothetical protein